MNKNELIEKAVAQLNGEWPKLIAPWENFVHYKTEVLMGIEWLFSAPDGCHLCTREEFNAAADRMRGKPDWSTLPAKAEWLAQDRCGIWKPMQGRKPTIEEGSYWVTDHHLQPQPRGTVIGDWRNTLEKRPEHIGDTNEKADPLNGYLWGVEYLFEGIKPDLPRDVAIKVKLKNQFYDNQRAELVRSVGHNRWNSECKAFRIVDERYKPSEPAPAKPWFEAGELPPERVKVEAIIELKHEECEVIAYFEDMAWLSVDGGRRHPVRMIESLKFRPIKTDKEKAIDFALGKINNGMNRHAAPYIIEQLYDAGLLRLPDQK